MATFRASSCSIFAAQPLKCVRENWVVPPGLRSFFPLFPALKRWAKLVRPSGAAFSSSSFHRIAKTSVLTHTLKRWAKLGRPSGAGLSLGRGRAPSSREPSPHEPEFIAGWLIQAALLGRLFGNVLVCDRGWLGLCLAFCRLELCLL